MNHDTHAADAICTLDDIPDGGAREFPAGRPGEPGVVVLRRADDAWAYRNVCPHFSIPLNYEPDTFWTYDAAQLMCAHHSAMFRFEDGLCVDGPCLGAALTAVPIRIERRTIFNADIRRQDESNQPTVQKNGSHQANRTTPDESGLCDRAGGAGPGVGAK